MDAKSVLDRIRDLQLQKVGSGLDMPPTRVFSTLALSPGNGVPYLGMFSPEGHTIVLSLQNRAHWPAQVIPTGAHYLRQELVARYLVDQKVKVHVDADQTFDGAGCQRPVAGLQNPLLFVDRLCRQMLRSEAARKRIDYRSELVD